MLIQQMWAVHIATEAKQSFSCSQQIHMNIIFLYTELQINCERVGWSPLSPLPPPPPPARSTLADPDDGGGGSCKWWYMVMGGGGGGGGGQCCQPLIQ